MKTGVTKGMKYRSVALLLLALLPFSELHAQHTSDLEGFHRVLDNLYAEMVPLSYQLMGVGRAIAGFAALFYIASRVWRHIANAEAVDFYPLLRPFALGLAIAFFPAVLDLMNGILRPVVFATDQMVTGSDLAIQRLLEDKQRLIENGRYWEMYVGQSGAGDRDLWLEYINPEDQSEGFLEGVTNSLRFYMEKASFQFQMNVKRWLSEILQMIFQAAALALNTIRVFYLIVLAILGPLVFGLSVFDGFQQTLQNWIARYINVFMWLPVANIFGAIIAKIQENMLRIDIGQIENNGRTFFSQHDTAYIIFMIIGIIGYFTVPSVANYIVHAGGRDSLLQKSNMVILAGPVMTGRMLRH
jgi:conjugative transposon TraJ protein